MRRGLLTVALFFSACAVAAAEDYCGQLQGAGLEGRLVTVNLTGADGRNMLEGRLAAVRPGIVVLELSGARAFVNCANVTSLVVAQTAARQGALPDTIERIWKAFGD